MLNPIIFKENDLYNPTNFSKEFYKDLSNLPIKEVYKKYESLLSPHEIAGFLIQEISVECSRAVINYRIENNSKDLKNQ